MERPILMTAESVKAILDGRKTMTRRVIVPQPKPCQHQKVFSEGGRGYYMPPEWKGQVIDWRGYKYEGRQGWFCYTCGNGLKHIDEWSAHGIICPYGQVGDRLWVRETWATYGVMNRWKPSDLPCNEFIAFRATHKYPHQYRWRPSIFMPRWASRLTLEITEVRVEKQLDITLEDAIKEGFGEIREFNEAFLRLNPHLKEANPWVWVIKFDNIGVRVK